MGPGFGLGSKPEQRAWSEARKKSARCPAAAHVLHRARISAAKSAT